MSKGMLANFPFANSEKYFDVATNVSKMYMADLEQYTDLDPHIGIGQKEHACPPER